MGKRRPINDRLAEKLSAPTDRGCREFLGHRNAQGYGKIGLGRRCVSAHRVAYMLAHGLAEDDIVGLDICHHCDNPPCCEPSHLFAGTEKDNVADMIRKGRWGGAVGSRSHLATLDEEKVRAMRETRRASGATYESIGRAFGVSKGAAWQAITGRKWRHVA